MKISNKLFGIFLLALSLFHNPSAYATSRYGGPSSYLENTEIARLIVIGEIASIHRKEAVGGLFEEYDLVSIRGNIIDSSGKRSTSDVVKMRTPPEEMTRFKEGRYVFVLSGKDLDYRSHDDSMPWLFGPVLKVREDNLYLHNTVLYGINDNGRLDFRPTNNCTIDQYKGGESRLTTSDGELIKEYAPEEVADAVHSFQCPDGTQWYRSRERKNNRTEQAITLRDFESILTNHLASLNLPMTSSEEINRDVPIGPAVAGNDLSAMAFVDELMVEQLEIYEERRLITPVSQLTNIYKRIELRRQTITSGDEDTNGIVDWDDYPITKGLLIQHNIFER